MIINVAYLNVFYVVDLNSAQWECRVENYIHCMFC